MRHASKLCQADPASIISLLVHPSVFALLELSRPLPLPESKEAEGVTALTYSGKKGYLLLRNDGIRVLIEAFYEDRPVLRCALRDRQLDGSQEGSPLTFFPNTDPACNRLPADTFLAAELSIYSWDPNTYLSGLDVEETIGHFIADPDFYLWRNFEPNTFFRLWEQAFFLGRAPWQTARPMSGVATFFVKQAAAFLKGLGYNRIDAVPSWYNVARFFKKIGYKFTYGEHELAFDAIARDLRRYPSLDHAQQSWLVALQNLPELYIPVELKLKARWPVTHTNMYWVRMHLDLQPAPARKPAGKLIEKICSMREVQAEVPILHTAANCPCTTSLGASSPGATSPAATTSPNEDPAEGETANKS